MIKIKNSELNDDTLNVLLEVMDYELDIETAIKLSLISKEISNILLENLKGREKIWRRWIKYDEGGSPLLDSSGGYIIEDEAMLDAELSDFDSGISTLDFDKFNPREIFGRKVSPNKIMKLSFLLDLN